MGLSEALQENLLATSQLGLGAKTTTALGPSGLRTPLEGLQKVPGFKPLETPGDEAAFRNALLQNIMPGLDRNANLGELPPDVQNTLTAIQAKLLPDTLRDDLDAITRAQLSEQELAGGEARMALLEDLFGRGVQRSSIAADEAGRFQFGQDVLKNQILAQGAQRQLDEGFRRLGLGGELALGAGSLGVNFLNARNQNQNARIGLLNQLFGQGLQRDVASEEIAAGERRRVQQDVQSRENQLIDLASQRGGVQAQRKSFVQQLLPALAGFASFAIPGGGSLGGALGESIFSKVFGKGLGNAGT